jgi:hypothetical protein
MALRRHVAERNSIRNKPVFGFRMPAIRSVVPALIRAHRART